ncbi:Undecaprenyl-phosphate 4-deoxy-4-formamido-L-arabinose transferase [wastewater metagenome]|uniref:Undecaprenyl-phosphate 4-deoxy-4-formamido-L-arabinose transferase n=2 Tax=unclassified sequences TaxID=12908 RepID=A0A5B8RHI9_9ZZZZ|nr:glycosyltransferase family 2 protein [Arhodomonas sp. KWT]QEA06954.1 undecaprenyl-phosphate 4-deoxy-4-formamido-L-arabinose transferase [uncultured organism]
MTENNAHSQKISVVIPAKNEEASIGRIIKTIQDSANVTEILVVDDGSTDKTASYALEAGARVISRPYSSGNGSAIKTGTRHALGDILVFMDADGQHNPKDIPRMLENLNRGFDMAVGARRNGSQANFGRGAANWIYNRLASYMTGHDIYDLTSGFRAAHAAKFREFLHLLPNGFSYPTTITMAFFRAGFTITYVPISADQRTGRSHIRPIRDGLRFLLIIFKVATLYSPLKIFAPTSAGLFCLGVGYYAYTYITQGRFTNMSALMLTTAILAFLIGLVSEQITQLMYKDTDQANIQSGNHGR